jgi:hypothetical protein
MNAPVTDDQIKVIRNLDDFDLRMFLGELHDFGLPQALALLPMILDANLHRAATHKAGQA